MRLGLLTPLGVALLAACGGTSATTSGAATTATSAPAASKVDVSRYKGLDFFVNSYKSSDKLFGMPANPIENFCATQWGTALNKVLAGKAQPKDALQQLQQQVTLQMKQEFPAG